MGSISNCCKLILALSVDILTICFEFGIAAAIVLDRIHCSDSLNREANANDSPLNHSVADSRELSSRS